MNSIDDLEKRTSSAADILLSAMENYKKALEDFTKTIGDINENDKKKNGNIRVSVKVCKEK